MDTVILAKNVFLNDETGTSRPNDNQIVIGGTGTGKTYSTVIPTLCHMTDNSFIGTFAKKSIVNQAAAYFSDMGYDTHIWNLSDPGKDDKIPDPLYYIKTDDDVQELAHQIANSNPDYSRSSHFDPYWRDASESLLTGLIYYVLMTEDIPSMKKVISMFYSLHIHENGKGITTTLDDTIAWLEKHAPDSTAVRKLRSFIQLPYATASCCRDDLEKVIQRMFPMSIQSAMDRAACVDFRDIADKRSAVFILTSSVRTAPYAFANLLFSIAIRQLMEYAESRENNCLPRNVKLIFDDFSCGFPLENFPKSISTFRAYGLSALLLCQSLSQLDATYGEDNSTVILDNCAGLVYLPGGMNKRTCSYIGEMLNMPLEDVMWMEMGKAVVFQAGKKPIITSRYDTSSDPLYKKFVSMGRKSEKHRREDQVLVK